MTLHVRRIAPRYMLEFRCLGSDCEDTCCRGWDVHVDEPHLSRLYQIVGRSEAERQRARDAFVPLPVAERTPDRFATVKHRQDGTCPYLDDKHLCDLHAAHGVEVLPNLCESYPRSVSRVRSRGEERLELSASLSCPEAARRAILVEDALDLCPAPADLYGRGTLGHEIEPAFTEPYARRIDEVRAALSSLLAKSSRPLSTRLFAIAWIGHQTRGYFHVGCEEYPRAHLEDALAAALDDKLLDDLDKGLAGNAAPVDRALDLVVRVLGLRFGGAAPQAFLDATHAAIRELSGDEQGEGGHLRLDALARRYAERRAALAPRFAARLDGALERFTRNYVLREWYPLSPNLLAYALGLALRVGILRVLVIGDPSVGPDATDEAFDRALVRAVYSMSRAIDHNTDFALGIAHAFDKHATSLAPAAVLLSL